MSADQSKTLREWWKNKKEEDKDPQWKRKHLEVKEDYPDEVV